MKKTFFFILLAAVQLMLLPVTALAAAPDYTVEFNYGGQEYVLPGDSSVKLSEILSALGMEGRAEKAESSDPALFEIGMDAEGDDWTVTARRAFTSRERLSVTLDGVLYDILVTDTPGSVVYFEYDPYMKELFQLEAYNYTLVDSSCTSLTLEAGHWYVIDGSVTLQSRVENKSQIGNPASIILKNGCTLNAPYGIENGSRNSLHIYGQDKNGGNGQLKIAAAPDNCAGIGGGYSPGLDTQGCGYVEINGGILEIHGGQNAAGIGGGDSGADVSVTINAGKVTAYGGKKGAGIGTGNGSTLETPGNGKIIINGGTVEAFGGDWGAGIGRGYHGYPNPVEITGGNVTARGGSRGAAGIGGGKDTSGVDTRISGGTVCAIGNIDSDYNAIGCGIGYGAHGAAHRSLTITGEQVGIYSGTGDTDATVITAETYARLREPYVRISIAEVPVYVVRHMRQKTDKSGYEKYEEEEKTAPAGSMTSASFQSYAGFTPAALEQLRVSADDVTVVEVLYGRNDYTIFFDANGHGTAPAAVTAPYEAPVSAPAQPQDPGYAFRGWFEDQACTKPYTFADDTKMPLNGAVLYAGWTEKTKPVCKVSWTLDDGTVIDTADVAVGEMPVHADAEKAGHIFTGWSPAPAPVTGDITYTAKFVQLTPEKVAVSFNTVGGTYVDTQVISIGEKAARPAADPVREGHAFGGWYTDASCSKAFDFSIPVRANTVVTAKWDILPAPADIQLCRIEISSLPAKTVYAVGESFDPAGMVITAYYNDNTSAIVAGYQLMDLHPFTAEDMDVTVRYTENSITREVKQAIRVKTEPSSVPMELYGIMITASPNKTVYTEGESFDPTDMVVNALYSRPVTDYSLSPFSDLIKTDTAVTVSYTENGVTKTARQPITVGSVKEPYRIIAGADQEVMITADSAVFSSDADFGKFVRVEVDGKEVASKYYTAKSGSTVITFSKDFIATLQEGKHTLCIVSDDGSASAGFTVISLPETGDHAALTLLTLLLSAGMGAILLISAGTRKRNEV